MCRRQKSNFELFSNLFIFYFKISEFDIYAFLKPVVASFLLKMAERSEAKSAKRSFASEIKI